MIDRLLAPIFEGLGSALTNLGKIVFEHVKNHKTGYAIGGGAAAVGGGAYVVGEAVGHKEGKKEGIKEQAARDEKKMNTLHQQHEKDRKRWKEEKQAYEDLLDEVKN